MFFILPSWLKVYISTLLYYLIFYGFQTRSDLLQKYLILKFGEIDLSMYISILIGFSFLFFKMSWKHKSNLLSIYLQIETNTWFLPPERFNLVRNARQVQPVIFLKNEFYGRQCVHFLYSQKKAIKVCSNVGSIHVDICV